jgi:cell division protein FtsZ
MIGVGESETTSRVVECVDRALHNPLLDVNIKGANGVLINIRSSTSMTLDEAHKIVESINEEMDENAKVVWGVQIDDEMKEKVRVTVIITGIKYVKLGNDYIDMNLDLETYH